MTSEEAIEELEKLKRYVEPRFYRDGYLVALDMAIEALSAKPTDLISRVDAIEEVREKLQDWGGYAFEEHREGLYEAIDVLESLPSAELTLQTPQTYGKSINQSNAEVVADLISRADAIEELGEYFDHLKRIDKRGIKRIEPISLDCKGIINKLPSADRPSGKWINEWKDIDGGRMYGACCSVCHTIGHTGYNYCPNCGAKMGSGFQ